MSVDVPTEITGLQQLQGLAELLRQASARYYEGDGTDLLMDDTTYDTGIRVLQAAVAAHPAWAGQVDDLLNQVSGGQASGDVRHAAPMLSLDKATDDKELLDFARRVGRLVGSDPDQLVFCVEPKLDGMAVSVVYENSQLARIVTRGNGQAGEDVTRNATAAHGIPTQIEVDYDHFEVRGEVVMTSQDFEQANRLRLAHDDPPFANPRNCVGGSLRTKHRTYQVPLHFYAYGLVMPGVDRMDHTEQMDCVRLLGFTPAIDILDGTTKHLVTGPGATITAIHQIEQQRPHLGVDIDGAVIKLEDAFQRSEAGEGTSTPRWAIAFKYPPDTKMTELLAIDVAVGRTGAISYTARVTPVQVGGTTISNISVHNPEIIQTKGLRLPAPGSNKKQLVWLYRANDVIPQISGPVNNDTEGTEPFLPPQVCPNCGGELDRTNRVWRCLRGRACGTERSISYAAGRDCLDLEGIGTTTVQALVSSGRVTNVADLFTLTADDLMRYGQMGEKNAVKVAQRIQDARNLPMSKIATSLGIRATGRSMSKRLSKYYGSMEAFRHASLESLQQVEAVGPDRAAIIREELDELSDVLDELAQLNIGQTETVDNNGPTPLAGMTVVVTGAMSGPLADFSRQAMKDLIERLGGRASDSVSTKTNLVISTESHSSKTQKARQLGVPIVSPEEFAASYLG